MTSGTWTTSGNWISSVPGSTASLVNTDTATFNNAGNGNTTITIDPDRNLRSLTFDTNAVSYTIGSAGANGGNSLLLSSGGAITMAGTIAGTGLTQTINAPLILEPATATTNGTYTITNASTDATNRFVIAGNISAGTTTGTQTLTLSGVNTGNNLVSGAISDGGASGGLAVTKAGTGVWTLSGANTYTGATTINSSGGTLVGIGEHAFGSTSGIFLNGNSGSVLSLRGDTSTSFTKASDNSLYAVTIISANGPAINVDQATVAGTGAKTMTIGTLGFSLTGTTGLVNFTGANNTSLSVGAVTGGAYTGSSTTTLTNSIAGGGTLTIASYTSGNTSGGETVIFGGAGTTIVTGAITPSSTVLGLSKIGTGTLILNGAGSTYTGATSIGNGAVSVENIGNAGGSSNLGSNGTINLGATTTMGALIYTGAGETSNKIINLAGTTGGATLNQSGGGTLKFTSDLTATGLGNKTLTLTGTGSGEISGKIIDSAGFSTSVVKTGAGEWRLTGSNTYTGLTTLGGGTLTLDFSATATAPASNIIAPTGTLSLSTGGSAGSATLSLIGKDGGASSQSFATSAMPVGTGGAFHINLTPGAGGTLTLNTGTMPARSNGSTLDYGLASGAVVTTTTGTGNNGLMVGLATINGADYATVNSGTVVAFSNYVNNTATTLGAQNQVADMTGGNTTISGTGNVNNGMAIRFNTLGSTTITLAPSRMLVIGGGQAPGAILVTSTVGANTTTITGGLLAGISSRDLVILQNNTAGDLQIDSRITSSGANALGFTKSGLGTVLLTSNNTYNNQTFINEGKVIVTGDTTTGNVQTLTTTMGSGAISGVDTTGLFIGQRVVSVNTGSAFVIQSINVSGSSIVLNGNATASGSTAVTFGDSGALGTATGATAVQVGAGAALQIGNGGGTGSLIAGQGIASSGTVIFNRSNAFTFSNTITGVGSVVQAGAGVTTLEGAQGYTGNTLVNAGTLLVNGSAAGSRAVVNSGGILGGSGTTGGITVNAGGKAAPGNSIGTLSTNNGDLVWNGESSSIAQMLFELSTVSNASDQLNLGTGIFDKGTGSVFAFDFLGTGGNGFTYTLINFGSTDFSVGNFSYTNLGAGLTGSFVLNSDSLQFTVVPEPSTMLLLAGGLTVLAASRRRRS